MLERGVTKLIAREHSHLIHLQSKKSGEYRLCLDSIALNKVTVGVPIA